MGLEDYYDYRFSLTAATFDKFEVTNEEIRLRTKDKKTAEWIRVVNPEKKTETGLHRLAYGSSDNYLQSRIAENIINILGHTQVYRFNNILEGSSFNQSSEIDADLHLAGDGRNLTQVLFQLSKRHAERYRYICELIQRILPEFKQFEFKERNGLMSLYWKAIHLKKSINAKATSGSSLRMFALVTLLNIPFDHLPSILLIDEPELGLHPDGIALIAAMIKSRSINKQFFVATQSPFLINVFNIDNIVVLKKDKSGTSGKTFNPADFALWLEDNYRPGELWLKNLFGGMT